MNDAKIRALQAKWERILEKEGLGDIEKCGRLRVYHDHRLRSTVEGELIFHPDKNAAKEAYYQLAGEFLHEHTFESAQERKIWELHSQGMPVREIARKIRQPKNWSQINKRLIRLRRLMLIKTSLP
jgi:hypothetical protein